MAGVLVALLSAAFEFVCPDPATAGIGVSAASGSWRSALEGNPALLSCELSRAAAATVARPYDISGLYSGRLDVMVRPPETPLALGCGLATNCLDRYQEHDLAFVASWGILPNVTVGAGCHGLGQVWAGEVLDLLVAVDVGTAVQLGTLRIGLSGRRINVPRLHDGSELPPLIRVGGSWQPVSDVTLAVDLLREGAEESAALGVELRLVPQLRLKAGLTTLPMCYSGGIGVDVGPVRVDYAWQFHPQLKSTHVAGAEVRWW
ncbi:MAG: hypothetical protein ABIK86_00195 [candidate division WOR-3 bacterium]